MDDKKIGYWIEGVPYLWIQGLSYDTSQRMYLSPGMQVNYVSPKIKDAHFEIQLRRKKYGDVSEYILPPNSKKLECSKLFQVLSDTTPLTYNILSNLRVEGDPLDIKLDLGDKDWIWKVLDYYVTQPLDDYINIVDPRGHVHRIKRHNVGLKKPTVKRIPKTPPKKSSKYSINIEEWNRFVKERKKRIKS